MDEKAPLVGNEHVPINCPVIGHAETRSSGFDSTVNCQVCNAVVPLNNKERQLVVKCPICSEATPIKGAPPGKQYVRCPCNCLLICKASTTRVGCPRRECQRVITLPAASAECMGPSSMDNFGTNAGTFPSHSGTIRVTCGNCHRPFSIPPPQHPYSGRQTILDRFISCLSGGSAINSSFLIAARCPQCRKVTSVGPAYTRVRWASYLLLTIVFLIIAIAVTVGTISAASTNSALYFLWSVLYLLVIIFAIRGLIFFWMPVSALEVSVVHA